MNYIPWYRCSPLSGQSADESQLAGYISTQRRNCLRTTWALDTSCGRRWLRRSPFEGLTLAQALRAAQISGSNRVDFNVLNFRPVHGGEWSGSLERAFRYFEFPDHSNYFSQKKAWI